jgi:hypothetical protein
MSTSYTSLLGLALPVTGELTGTWGAMVDNAITSPLDIAVAGTQSITGDSNVTLSVTNGDTSGTNLAQVGSGSTGSAQYAIILCSGARTALRTITAPAASKIYTIINSTTGGFAVKIVGSGPTTGLTIPNGSSAVIAWNGSDFIEVGSSTVGNFTVNGNLTVTGTSTLTGAVTNTAGTANGVAYLNGSKVLTTGTALVFDGTNLGIGVTPSAWASTAIQLQRASISYNSTLGANEVSYNAYRSSGSTYNYIASGDTANIYRQYNGQHLWFTAPSGTAGNPITFTQAMTLTANSNLLIGTTTDFTTTSTSGNVAIAGYGIYPYTGNSGTANTTGYSSLNIETAFSGTGAANNYYYGIISSPKLTATATGGALTTGVYGFSSAPSIQSSSTTARLTAYGFVGSVVRNASTDTSTNTSNLLVGGQFNVSHGISAAAGIVTGSAFSVNAIAQNNNGTINSLYGVTSQLNIAGQTTSLSSTTTTAVSFNGLAFTVGAASGGPGAVTNGYGVYLVGPTVGATGTVTNYYAFYAGTPTVTGTLTNRYGVWIDDASSINYFAGNTGIGTSSPGVKLDVAGTMRGASTTITGSAGGTITPTSGTTNEYTITALGAGATFAIPSGTPIDGQKLIIRIKDDGTARALTWTTSAGGYRVIGLTLPTTTVASKVYYIGCLYNSQDSYWDVVAVTVQA